MRSSAWLRVALRLSTAPAATPAALAWLLVTPALTWLISGSAAAFLGSSFFTAAVSWARLALGALITMALPAGMPSDLATWSETTASMPSMPTVPNPPTRRFSCLAPSTCTVPPSGSLSFLPIV